MDKENFCKEIVEASKTGTFLECVYQASRGDQRNRDDLADLLVSVHNRGELDIVNEFRQLENKPHPERDFFLTRHLFEKILPRLNSPVSPVMECVQHLVEEAGNDMAAGWLIPPFIEFCKAEQSRSEQGLDLVLASPEQWSNLLSPILVAGSTSDLELFFKKAIELKLHEDVAIRTNAVHALGMFQFPKESEYPKRTIDFFEEVARKEDEDQVLACLVSATLSICVTDNSLADKGKKIIEAAFSKGSSLTLHAASQIFAYEKEKLSEKMLDIFLTFLLNVDPKHAGTFTLSNIGVGVANLLKQSDPTGGIEFLESLLFKHHGDITIKSLDHLVHSIINKGNVLLGKLLTRWFLAGDPILCDSISSILNKMRSEDVPLEIDPAEIPSADPVLSLFIARKTIGFLFMKPVVCASLILSLMKNTQDKDLLHDLSTLLFDPILLNFSGKPYDFLKGQINNLKGPVKKVTQRAIDAIDTYLENLRSMPKIPEMFPSQEQREAKLRRHNRIMSESFKETQKGSLMDLICSKSVLLYGNASIMHIKEGIGEARRMEIPMQHHEISMEIPKQNEIDPFGLDYTLRVFRNERIVYR